MKKILLLSMLIFAINSTVAQAYSLKYENGKFGVIDNNGNYYIEPIFDGAFSYQEGYYVMKINDKYALYKDNSFEEIFPAKYDGYDVLDKNFVAVRQNDKQAVFSIEGKQLTDFIYYGIEKMPNLSEVTSPNHQLFAIFNEDTKFGVIDKNNSLILPIEFDSVVLNNYYIIVKKDDKYGLYDRLGNKLYDTNYKKITIDEYDGTIKLFETDYRWKTHIISEENKNAYEALINNTQILYKDENNDFISKSVTNSELEKYSDKIIPPTYQSAKVLHLSNNNESKKFLIKKENSKYILMDENYKELSNERYDFIDTIGNKYLKVINNGFCTLFNIDFKPIIKIQANELDYINDSEYFIAYTDEGFIPYNVKGEKIGDLIFAEYQTPRYVPNVYSSFAIIAIHNGKKGVLNPQGKLIIPAIYDEIEFNVPKINLLKDDGTSQYYDLNKKKLSK